VGKKSKVRFKVGDRIVEAGKVFRIFKVRYKENGDGEEHKVMFFKPQYKKNTNGMVCSIPVESADEARIRTPVTKAELKELLQYLEKKTRTNGKVDTSIMDSKLNKNRAKTTAYVLKRLWVDKNNENTSFSPTKKRIYTSALRTLSEELAWLEKSSLKKAKVKIRERLEKALS
jgi:RNA polymerase-interacting CarD/CdnL/TRCF family regulator